MQRILAFLMLSWLFFCACQSSEHVNVEDSKKFLEIVDSIKVNYLGNLYLTDFCEKTEIYLSFDLTSDTIVEFDDTGAVRNKFNPTKEGPEGIKDAIIALAYHNDSTILVQSREGYYFYNKEGSLLRKIVLERDSPLYSNMKYNVESLSDLIFSMDRNFSNEPLISEEYYKDVHHISEINLKDSSITPRVKFDKKSLYLQSLGFYYFSSPAFDFNKMDSSLNILFPAEKVIYKYYPFKDWNLGSVIKTNPLYFNDPIITPFNQRPHTMRSLSYGSYYQNIFSAGEYLVVEYRTGLPKTVDLPGSIEELNDIYQEKNNYCYELYRDDEKIASDFTTPEHLFGLRILKNNGELIFQLNKNRFEYDFEVFYKCKISL